CVLVALLPKRGWRTSAAALAAGAAVHATALGLFTGRSARTSGWAQIGPLSLSAAVAVAIGLATWGVLRALERGQRRVALLALGAAALFFTADLTLFVSLYGRLHTLLELAATFSLVTAFVFGSKAVSARVVRGAAVAATCWGVVFIASGSLRRAHEDALRNAWHEPVYAGRFLRRVRTAETSLGLRPDAKTTSPIALLGDHFDLADTTLHPSWRTAPVETPDLRRDLSALREGKTDFDILVYYVDTLRQDVAADASVMPEVSRFSQGAMNFRSAYATGSDTLHSLPSLVGGRYGSDASCGLALLPSARTAGVTSSLFIAESAREFLSSLLPSFAFDRVTAVPDHEEERRVWGYGADRPTASALVDRTLDWLEREKPARHVTWLFNFDLHDWRELDRSYVDSVAARFDVPEEGAWNWQYRVVARSIDAQFGRLIAGLERLGRLDRTIVLFVSDHGEGLGYQGFWVHSVFLWEPLVRVPLLLRVPGLPPAVIDETVSLVDVAPTLSRFFEPHRTADDCHGADLLAYASPHRPAHHPPILFEAISEGRTSKLGLIDGTRKLVVPLDSGEPQLYDLTLPVPDEVDVAAAEPARVLGLVERLVRSPIVEREEAGEPMRASR
ncbi:MAG: sulfatase-like hydrolase/transferase, partial [Polyangiaceae bacterium]